MRDVTQQEFPSFMMMIETETHDSIFEGVRGRNKYGRSHTRVFRGVEGFKAPMPNRTSHLFRVK